MLPECKIGLSLWITVWQLFLQLNAELLAESASPLLGIFPVSQIQEPESALVFTATVMITTTGSSPTVYQQVNREANCSVGLQWSVSLPYKGIKFSWVLTTPWTNLGRSIVSEIRQCVMSFS